jgi:ABC-type transport system involved in multi-copper enzyme maturation permease subunit
VLPLLKANILTDIAYYRRSRLLLAFLLVFLLMTGLSSLPPLFADSSVQSFNALQGIYTTLSEFLLLFAGGLGLFVISSHLRNRSLKMVFTKPCSPAVWLASAFLAAVVVSLVLNGVVLGTAVLISYGFHLPVRGALLFISLDTFIASVGIVAYLMLLGMVMHPAIAATFALIFNAGLFYDAQTWSTAVIRSGNSSLAVRGLNDLFHYLYLLLPMVRVFGEKTQDIYNTFRVAPGEWKLLFYSFGYALAVSTFCYLLALLALHRKKLI